MREMAMPLRVEGLPDIFPDAVRPRAEVVIAEASAKSLRDAIAHIIAGMTPTFLRALREGTVPADSAISRMRGVLGTLVEMNPPWPYHAETPNVFKQGIWISRDWIEFLKAIEAANEKLRQGTGRGGEALGESAALESGRSGPVPEASVRGERSQEVAARRAELRNMLRGTRKPTAKDVCKRWDATGIRVPEKWQGRFATWQDAYADPQMRANVKKLISTDTSRILRPKH
jgi:hypothetical protein